MDISNTISRFRSEEKNISAMAEIKYNIRFQREQLSNYILFWNKPEEMSVENMPLHQTLFIKVMESSYRISMYSLRR